MITEVILTQLGETMDEGTISAWHKRVGDRVAAGDEICDIETDKMAGGLNACRHIGQLESHCLKFRNRLAKLLMMLGVFESNLVGALGKPQRHGADRNTTAVESGHELLETGTGLPQLVLVWNEAVIKMEYARVRSPHAKLVFFLADTESLCARLDDKRGNGVSVLNVRCSRREYYCRGNTAIGYPALGAVNLETAIDFLGKCLGASGIGTGPRLG